MTDIQTLITFAHELADAAGVIAERYFYGGVDVEIKSDLSPVTAADREIEQAMRSLIQQRFPGHGIVGEEFADLPGASDYAWTLDPIDGTQSFVCGVPLFGTLIALYRSNEPLMGLIDMPILGERYWATADGIAQQHSRMNLTPQPLRTSSCQTVGEARVFAAHPAMFTHAEKARFDVLTAQSRIHRYSADCYAYALLAKGQVDIVAEANMKPHDYRALIPVVERAGGIITDWAGQSLAECATVSTVLAAANQELHQKAQQVLADSP